MQEQSQWFFTVRNNPVLLNILPIVIKDGLGFSIRKRDEFRNQIKAPCGQPHHNGFGVGAITDAFLFHFPFVGIRNVQGLVWHSDLANIMEQTSNDATFFGNLWCKGLFQG